MSEEFLIWFSGWASRHTDEILELYKKAMWDAWQKNEHLKEKCPHGYAYNHICEACGRTPAKETK